MIIIDDWPLAGGWPRPEGGGFRFERFHGLRWAAKCQLVRVCKLQVVANCHQSWNVEWNFIWVSSKLVWNTSNLLIKMCILQHLNDIKGPSWLPDSWIAHNLDLMISTSARMRIPIFLLLLLFLHRIRSYSSVLPHILFQLNVNPTALSSLYRYTNYGSPYPTDPRFSINQTGRDDQ